VRTVFKDLVSESLRIVKSGKASTSMVKVMTDSLEAMEPKSIMGLLLSDFDLYKDI